MCLHTQPPSHLSQHHLVSFWGSSGNSEISYGRDSCHLQAEGTRGGDASQSCFQGKYYLHRTASKKMQLTPLKPPQCGGQTPWPLALHFCLLPVASVGPALPTSSWRGSLGMQAAGSVHLEGDRTAKLGNFGGSCSSPKDLLDNCLVRQRKL